LFSSFVELHGDRAYRDDPAIIGGLAILNGNPVLLIAQEGHMMSFPEGYRKARRLLLCATKFRLPVITLIHTPGAIPGLEADYRGLGMAIADCLATMATLETAVVAVVIGEGGSGGALALGVADVVLMQENAIYSVISPEGAAAILYRDLSRSAELAPALKLRARDLLELKIVDDIVPEPACGAHAAVDEAAELLLAKVLLHVSKLVDVNPKKLVARRLRRFRSIGTFEREWITIARHLLKV